MTGDRFYAEMRELLRARLLDAAAELICAEGWSAVTMARVAARVGVSRQQVYKHFDGKAALAEALAARETDRILDGVVERLRRHHTDVATGVADAVEFVLREGAESPLVKAVVLGAHGGDTDLLPLLATHPEPVLGRAIRVVLGEVRSRYAALGLPEATLTRAAEVVVRLTLSHLLQPTVPIDAAVAEVRTVAEALLWHALTRPHPNRLHSEVDEGMSP